MKSSRVAQQFIPLITGAIAALLLAGLGEVTNAWGGVTYPIDASAQTGAGPEVDVLAKGSYPPGRYQVNWGGGSLRGMAPAGQYFIRYEVAGQRFLKRLVLTR